MDGSPQFITQHSFYRSILYAVMKTMAMAMEVVMAITRAGHGDEIRKLSKNHTCVFCKSFFPMNASDTTTTRKCVSEPLGTLCPELSLIT